MDTMKTCKVLTVLLCIELLSSLQLHRHSVRDNLRGNAVAYLECLLRELRRDLVDEELNRTKSGFWRSYQKFMIPRWLHNCYVEILRTRPKEEDEYEE